MDEHMSEGVSGCPAIEKLPAYWQTTAPRIEMLDEMQLDRAQMEDDNTILCIVSRTMGFCVP